MNRAKPFAGRAALYAALLLAATVVLEAHITIAPGEVRANSSQRFTVRVPSERPEATVKLRVEFPEGLGAPRFLSKPPWKYELEKDATGRVTAVTWSGGEIGPNEFDEFVFTARAPARPGPITFKASQTYKSGTVAAWLGGPGDKEPAPVVEVRDSTFVAPTEGATVSAAPTAAPAPAEGAAAPAQDNPDAMSLVALALSMAALGLAIVGLRRRA